MRILIVDDEEDFVETLKERISHKGDHIDVAYDGKRALELLKANGYDLVFLDHNMPELTGLELIKYIKDNNLAVKTVMVTAYAGMEESLARSAGADEYLNKPVKMKEVEDIIEKYRRK